MASCWLFQGYSGSRNSDHESGGNRTLYLHGVPELEVFIPRNISDYPVTDEIEIQLFFGETIEPQFKKLATRIFEEFHCPLMRLKLQHHGKGWRISYIHPFSVNTLRHDCRNFFSLSLTAYTRQRWVTPKVKTALRHDLAILYNPAEQMPPAFKLEVRQTLLP